MCFSGVPLLAAIRAVVKHNERAVGKPQDWREGILRCGGRHGVLNT